MVSQHVWALFFDRSACSTRQQALPAPSAARSSKGCPMAAAGTPPGPAPAAGCSRDHAPPPPLPPAPPRTPTPPAAACLQARPRARRHHAAQGHACSGELMRAAQASCCRPFETAPAPAPWVQTPPLTRCAVLPLPRSTHCLPAVNRRWQVSAGLGWESGVSASGATAVCPPALAASHRHQAH